MTFEEVLTILVKYNVQLPVGAMIELGIIKIPDKTQSYMSRQQLVELARKGGAVRWNSSGLVEQVVYKNNSVVLAWGKYTRPHEIKEGRSSYACQPWEGNVNLATDVDLSRIPPGYLRGTPRFGLRI